MNIPRSPAERDDIVKIHNYEGIFGNWVRIFTTFLTVTDCVLALSELNG